MPSLVEPLQRKLASARRWWRASRLLSGLAWAVSVVILLSLICYYWDSRWTLNSHGREMWRLLILGCGAAVLAVALLRALLDRLPDMRMAALVERRFPVLQERLLTTLDLAPALNAPETPAASAQRATFSDAMTSAVAEETRRASSDLDFRRAVDLRPLRLGGSTLLFMIALLGLQVLMAGPAFANWLHRMADPRADIAPYAHTRVQVIPEASLLPAGSGVWVDVKTWGDPADHATLHLRRPGDAPGAWSSLDLGHAVSQPASRQEPDETNRRRFRIRLDHLAGGLVLYATANDGRSNEREIMAAARPALLNIRLRIHYPNYMRRDDKTIDAPDGSFAAPFGSTVNVTATANNPLKSATILRDHGASASWNVEGKQAYGHLDVSYDSAYTLKLIDTNRFDNTDPPHYTIHAEKDLTPVVQISRPATDMDLTPGGSLPLVARADDDYGVTAMKLAWSKTHDDLAKVGNARTVHEGGGALDIPGANGSPHAVVEQRWHLSSVAPKPGDTVQYEVEAQDNDTLDGPHVGRSLAYHIHVVSVPEMQARLKEQLDEEQRALQQLRQHQIQAQQQVERSRVKRDPTLTSQAQQAQRSVAQETQSLSERVQQLSNQLENNDMATRSEMQRRDEAQQTLENDAQRKMPAAADTIQQAQNSGRKADSRSLDQADRQQSEIHNDIDRARQLLSRVPTPDQLAQEAARLAQQQQQLADSASSLAEDQRSQHQTSAEDKTGLQMERQQQAQTSQDTQQLQRQLDQAAEAAQERGDTKAAQALKHAGEQLRKGDATGNQQQAQGHLDHNDPQSASPAQNRAAKALQQAAQDAQQASGQPPSDASQTQADRMDQAAQALKEMAQEQHKIASQAGQNPGSSQSHALAQQQQALQQRADQMQQQLGGSPRSQQSLQSAQQSMNQAGQQLSQNQAQAAQSPAEKAAQQLDQAAQQAEEAARQLRQEQKAQELQAQVERLAQLEHGLHDATQRLEKVRQDGNLTSNDMVERRQVGARQEEAEKEARSLAEQMPSASFQEALRMAARQMHPATRNLKRDEPNTGTQTQAAQEQATQTLDTISRALQQQAQNGSSQSGQPGQSGQSAQQDEAAEALGELQLAQGLEKQLRQDTGALDQARGKNQDHALNQEQQEQADQLTQGQRSTREITRKAESDLQSQPDALQSVQQAEQHMDQAGQRLDQQQTGRETQGHEDQALQQLNQAVQQAQQSMQQQQQQQQAQQQGQQGAPQPGQVGSDPNHQPFTKLVGAQRGAMSSPDLRPGHSIAALPPRTQRALREGRTDKVPAEFQDLVSRYYRSLAEKPR